MGFRKCGLKVFLLGFVNDTQLHSLFIAFKSSFFRTLLFRKVGWDVNEISIPIISFLIGNECFSRRVTEKDESGVKLLPLLPIIRRFWEVVRATSCILRAAVCKFELVILLLLESMQGSIVHHWVRLCFSSSVWFV